MQQRQMKRLIRDLIADYDPMKRGLKFTQSTRKPLIAKYIADYDPMKRGLKCILQIDYHT